MKPIAITTGEPAGIGPDLIVKLSQCDLPYSLVIIGDPNVIAERAELLNVKIEFSAYKKNHAILTHQAGQLCIHSLTVDNSVIPGQLNTANVSHVLAQLETAAHACLTHEFAAVVTGPVHKGIINQAGIKFTGQTEFLAAACASTTSVMMLANEHLRVALVTTHLPVAKIAAHITAEKLETILRILQKDLQQRFGLAHPRILVCGLNPHAGEGGHLGHEEIDIIIPVIEKLKKEGFQLTGPTPADTAFTLRSLAHADVVVAMYHDQGLPVLKYAGFGDSVNITLGLPIIRTSVDHGTALDLAGSGHAEVDSLLAAIKMAHFLVNNSHD